MPPSTRARSASVEARASKKPKSTSRVKESALSTVQESPRKQPAGPVSAGAIAQKSVASTKEQQPSVESLIEGLQELWTTSDQFLNKLVAEQPTKNGVDRIVERLQSSARFRNDILQQHDKLVKAMSTYPGMPIKVSDTTFSIFGQQNIERIDSEVLRPDNILYRANLAYVLGVLVIQIIDGMKQFDSLEMLENFFKTFSRVIKSNEKATRGSTSCLKATFDLALELRTSEFWEALDDARENGVGNLDEFELLSSTFYENSVVGGWDVDGLRGSELKQDQRQSFTNRLTTIREKLESTQNQDGVREAQPSYSTLIYQCFTFAYQRNKEIARLMSRIPDGVLGVQESIDEEIERLGISGPENTIRLKTGLAQPPFIRPEVLARVKASIKGNAKQTAAPSSATRQQSSGETSAFTAPDRQPEENLVSTNPNDDAFEPLLFIGDEGGEDQSDAESVFRELEHSEPTKEQKMRLSQHVAMKTKQANKENLPDKGGKANQVLSQSRKPGNGNPNSSTNYGNKGKNKRDREEYEEDDISISQDGDDDEESEAGYETQRTPEKARQQRTKQPPPSRPMPSREVVRNSAGTGNGQPNRRATSPAEPSRTQRADVHHEVNAEAKQRVADFKMRNQNKARVAWSDEETECLLEYIDEYGTQWARMLEHDASSEGRNILWQRDNVSLKDKARNIRLDFLKANRPLPPGLEKVTLRSSDLAKLRAMGLWDDSGEAQSE